ARTDAESGRGVGLTVRGSQVRMEAHESGGATRRTKLRLPPEQDGEGVDVADDHASTGTDDSGEFPDGALNVVQVHECQRAHDHVDRLSLEGERLEVPLAKIRCRNFPAGSLQHLGRAINAYDPVATPREVFAVPARATRGIEDTRRRKRVEQPVHDRLFE